MFLFARRKIKNIIFILGAPRSGTTWLWSLLESNQNTIPFLDGRGQNKDGSYDSSESGAYIRDFKNAYSKIYKFSKKNKDKIVIEKTPSHTLVYKSIMNDFPKGKYLVIFRHPIAIVNSMIKSEMKAFKNHDINHSIKSVKEYYLKLEELSKIEGNIILTYENLLENTKPTLTNIFEKLNLDINNVDEIIEKNKLKTRIKIKGVLRKGIIDSYNEDLSESDLNYIHKELIKEISLFNEINRRQKD